MPVPQQAQEPLSSRCSSSPKHLPHLLWLTLPTPAPGRGATAGLQSSSASCLTPELLVREQRAESHPPPLPPAPILLTLILMGKTHGPPVLEFPV